MSNALAEMTAHARRELSKLIVGQQEPLDLLLLTIVCGGHALIEGVPGVARTFAAQAATSASNRVQWGFRFSIHLSEMGLAGTREA